MYLRTGYSVFPMLKALSETFKLQLLHSAFLGKLLRIWQGFQLKPKMITYLFPSRNQRHVMH